MNVVTKKYNISSLIQSLLSFRKVIKVCTDLCVIACDNDIPQSSDDKCVFQRYSEDLICRIKKEKEKLYHEKNALNRLISDYLSAGRFLWNDDTETQFNNTFKHYLNDINVLYEKKLHITDQISEYLSQSKDIQGESMKEDILKCDDELFRCIDFLENKCKQLIDRFDEYEKISFDEDRINSEKTHKRYEKEAPAFFSQKITVKDGEEKHITIRIGNMCKSEENYDVVVCSSFINNYYPVPHTLIGGLQNEKGISVSQLSAGPELDLRVLGAWLSHKTGTNFQRIACIELADFERRYENDLINDIKLKKTFSTLRFLLEQADIQGIPISRVALPILGTGDQQIELCYIAAPLLSQCISALKNIDGLKEIVFYEMNADKAQYFKKTLIDYFKPSDSRPADLFISYSTKQQKEAYEIKEFLEYKNISCWMAPDSISAGASYEEEIPIALSKIPLTFLLLTEDAMESPWVSKEIGTSIGSGHAVFPCQLYDFNLSCKFSFLLHESQIFHMWKHSRKTLYQKLMLLFKNNTDM